MHRSSRISCCRKRATSCAPRADWPRTDDAGFSRMTERPRDDTATTSAESTTAEDRTARNIGVGCFTTFIGLWSGAMVAVFIGKLVEGMRGAPTCEGLPLCNWHVYAAA